jgi:hypothetical protein
VDGEWLDIDAGEWVQPIRLQRGAFAPVNEVGQVELASRAFTTTSLCRVSSCTEKGSHAV